MTKKWTIILFIIFIIILTIWAYNNTNQKLLIKNVKINAPSSIGFNMSSTIFNYKGLSKYTISSPKVQSFKKNNITIFQNPIIFSYSLINNKWDKTWKINSDIATYTKDISTISLYNNILMSSLNPSFIVQSIKTNQLNLNTKTNIVENTNTLTQIKGTKFISTGNNVIGYINQKNIYLTGSAKSVYK
ncbi:MAG: LPS export ABC transporter periplasmic protein LptC [Psittacicella sp.]